jgi:hypothetical protein
MLAPMGRVLIATGLVLAVLGAMLLLAQRFPFLSRRGSLTPVLPLGTSLLLPVVLTLILNLLLRK